MTEPPKRGHVAEAEIILNLWYVHDDAGFIYSLRARCYVGSGNDESDLLKLREFAEKDYVIAHPFPVPNRFHSTVVEGNVQRKIPAVHGGSLDPLGGPQALFEDAFLELDRQLPADTKLSIGKDPLVCITPLVADENDEIKSNFRRRARFDQQ